MTTACWEYVRISEPRKSNYNSCSNLGCSRATFQRIEINWEKPVPHFARDPLDPPLGAPGGPRTPIWGGGVLSSSPALPPPLLHNPTGLAAPASVPGAATQGLKWWRGSPEAVTRGGSQWGLQGGRRRRESRGWGPVWEGDSNKPPQLLLCDSFQAAARADFTSSAFISNLLYA